MTTIHAYTADQRLQDAPHKDLRRARAAAINLVPASTGAAKAIGLVIPELRASCTASRCARPCPTGSVVDLTIVAGRDTTVEEINEAFASQADTGALDRHPAVHRRPDRLLGHRQVPVLARSSTPQLTAVLEGNLVKVVAWYDNEWGYSNRCVDLAQKVLVRAHA